ncbi:hypothetical protein ACI6PS_11565 [Flavobacterium sp. PLA-1-15]|uniref:hypothetical protein n=1 Tax=Flavobacterium sp. PLA-1-15 TaxID=3380533 RepID=UPI003B823169
MKKIIIALSLFVCAVSHSQMKVSETEKLNLVGEYKLLGKSYAKIQSKDSLYIFTYRDEKFTTVDNYKSFVFRGSDKDALLNMFINFEGIEKGTEKTVDLEDGDKLFFTYKKTLGKMYAEVIHLSKSGVAGAIRWLTEKQAKNVFGKNK